MALIGWYYLHVNGDLIYKQDFDGTVADLRESDFVRHLWPLDPEERAGAWNILVEAGALGAHAGRIAELARKWRVDDEDAPNYASYLGCVLKRDGSAWHAHRADFVNLQESPSGFGDTALQAFSELCKALGFHSAKMWGPTMSSLCAAGRR